MQIQAWKLGVQLFYKVFISCKMYLLNKNGYRLTQRDRVPFHFLNILTSTF